MLDRMAPDGSWYDSTTTSEAYEPIGFIVATRSGRLRKHWKAYFKGRLAANRGGFGYTFEPIDEVTGGDLNNGN